MLKRRKDKKTKKLKLINENTEKFMNLEINIIDNGLGISEQGLK